VVATFEIERLMLTAAGRLSSEPTKRDTRHARASDSDATSGCDGVASSRRATRRASFGSPGVTLP
jgi:hypothetical protein